MNRAIGLLTRGHRCLLRLYPASFRSEFAAEMDQVFSQAVADAALRGWRALVRLCLREVVALPGDLGREWASALQARLNTQEEDVMEHRPSPHDSVLTVAGAGPPAPWPEAILAALAVLVPGLALVGVPVLAQIRMPIPPSWHRALVFGSYLFILLGVLAGWIRAFPRWSYPYVGYGLLFPLWMGKVSTPGLELLGYAFSPNEVWGWRAWLGLGAVIVVALLLTRSLRPLSRFFIGAWRDCTRLSLALYGCLPFVIRFVFDDVPRPYAIPFMIVTSLLLAAGALAHMRSQNTLHRMLSLQAGLTAAWLVASAGLALYWTGRLEPYWRTPLSWSEATLPLAFGWVVLSAILLVPVLLSLLQRTVHTLRAA